MVKESLLALVIDTLKCENVKYKIPPKIPAET